MKNFLTALFLSHGPIMLTMGDELSHSKNGNNNTWCHDSVINWIDWNKTDTIDDLTIFISHLAKVRDVSLCHAAFLTDQSISWHKIDWSNDTSLLAYTLHHKKKAVLFVIFNGAHSLQSITVPHGKWRYLIQTNALYPNDSFALGSGPILKKSTIQVAAHSTVVFEGCV